MMTKYKRNKEYVVEVIKEYVVEVVKELYYFYCSKVMFTDCVYSTIMVKSISFLVKIGDFTFTLNKAVMFNPNQPLPHHVQLLLTLPSQDVLSKDLQFLSVYVSLVFLVFY